MLEDELEKNFVVLDCTYLGCSSQGEEFELLELLVVSELLGMMVECELLEMESLED